MKLKTLYSLLTPLALTILVGGCKSSVYDDLSVCDRNFALLPYSQTECDALPSYPKTIKELRVFAFDKNGILQKTYEDKSLTLTENYRIPVEIAQGEKMTYVIWGGENLEEFEFSKLEIGKTKMSDISMHLLQKETKVETPVSPLFVGKQEIDPETYPQEKDATVVKVNLKELTYRFNFTIKGLPGDRKFIATISDNNTKFSVDGSLQEGADILYSTPLEFKGDLHKANLSTLVLKKGRNAILTIREEGEEKVIWQGNIVEDLLFASTGTDAGNAVPPYNLDCDHDFDISMTLQYVRESWMMLLIRINGWNIVQRDVEVVD